MQVNPAEVELSAMRAQGRPKAMRSWANSLAVHSHSSAPSTPLVS